jgi:hypothetical protein
MDRGRPVAGWRAATFAAALFAITLNFLQPLAHAALLRDGGTAAAASLWGAFCLNMGGGQDEQSSVPGTAKIHQCCLGLAHANAVGQPPTAFIAVEPRLESVCLTPQVDALTAVGIRDGPSQPRGPPSPT